MRKIKLIMDHISAGVHYKAGETVEVTDEDFQYLQEAYGLVRDADAPRIQKLKDLKVIE